ncbi:MAG: serpin family protein [Ruminococcus sp.]|nr:serpin family protein [Candidatus Apopatosoma intestinale]
MKKIATSVLSLILCAGMLLCCTSCGNRIIAGDLTEGMLARKVDGKPTDEALATAYTVFAGKLLASLAEEGKNTLVSPLSVIIALSLAGNGAKGQTRDEIEALLGSGVISLDDMNEYLYSYVQGLYDEHNRYNTDHSKIKLANSVWFREGFPVKETYLQKVTDYYLANAYELPFDNAALKKINDWCAEKTDDMIKKVIDEIDPATMMYLINALLFEADWSDPYERSYPGTFTKADGTEQKADMLCSTEYGYLETANAIGFSKAYDGWFDFVALLPNEGVSTAEVAASLSAGEFLSQVKQPDYAPELHVKIPKFEYDCGYTLNETLKALGIPTAFSQVDADFTDMADVNRERNNLYIGRVIHKTHIELNERGTKAAAVTAIEMKCGSAMPIERKEINIFLDRPFVYAITDRKTGMPIFVGVIETIK